MHELRTLTRTRKQLVREQTQHGQRIQKTLTEANIRLDFGARIARMDTEARADKGPVF